MRFASQTAIGAAFIGDALKPLHDPQGLYEQMAPKELPLVEAVGRLGEGTEVGPPNPGLVADVV